MSLETKIEKNVKQAVPFFGVTDIQASLKFYVDGLGFTMKHHSGSMKASCAGAGWNSAMRP